MVWTKEKRQEYMKQYMKQYNQKHKKERNEYQKQWAKKNPEKEKEYNHRYKKKNREKYKEYMKKWFQSHKKEQYVKEKIHRQKRKIFVEDLKKKGKCILCGYSDYRALEYHHKNPGDKKSRNCEIGRMVYSRRSIKNIKNEIKRCVLLCTNCHKILHYADGGKWRNKCQDIQKHRNLARKFTTGM